MKITNIKIVTKIIISFMIIIILAMTTFVFLIYEIKNTEKVIGDFNSTFFNVSRYSLGAELEINKFNNTLEVLVYTLEQKDGVKSVNQINKLLSIDISFRDKIENLKKWMKDEKGKNLLTDVEEWFDNWEEVEKEIIKEVRSKEYSIALQNIKKAEQEIEELVNIFRLMDAQAKVIAENSNNIVTELIKRIILISVISSLILIGLVITIAIFISKNIFRSLSFFKEIFSKGASGDLDARYPVKAKSRDELNELGSFFNNFMDKVRNVTQEVSDTSNDLGVSSEEVSDTITSFADNSQNQAASSEEITATMEEISAGIDNVYDNSQYQYNKLNEFISLINELSEIINIMAGRITDAQKLSKNISDQAKAGNESLSMMDMIMNKITESSNKVSEIVNIINSISDKINLLSLNAAIEAARAGEAGRGFAVVADEISKLADQTATSINDIDSLIKKNKDEIADGMQNVLSTVDNISRVIEGVESINNMMIEIYSEMERQQSTNESVNNSAEELRIRSEEVKNASEEQKIAVSEVMKSITNINDLIQASASGAEEMTVATNKLASMAENLKGKIGFFRF